MKKVILIVLLGFITTVNAQNFKFGKVSKEELLETNYNNDSLVDAAVIYRELRIHYPFRQGEGFDQYIEVFERLKIYNKTGYKYATIKNKLYDESSKKEEKIEGLKAYTYSLIDGKVVKDKLRKEGIFEEKINQYWKSHKFTMPNLKEGSVIEYTYRIESPFISIDDINLQYDIPIKKSKIEILIPEYFVFNKQNNPKAVYRPKLEESSMNRAEVLKASQVTLTQSGGFQTGTNKKNPELKFIQNKTEITDSNIPALNTEEYVDNINNYRGKLIMEYVAYKGSDGLTKNYASTWEDVCKTIYNSSDFGEQLSKNNYFKDDVDAIISNQDDDQKIITKIYELIKSKVKWNGLTGYKSNESLRKVYNAGSGNVGEINLMLVAMLRYAGVRANPVLLSTRDKGIPLTPTIKGFNYVICRVKLDEGVVFLDATSSYGTANILPKRALNWQGRVVDEQGNSDWVSLRPETISNEKAQMNINIQNDFSIKGKLRQNFSNYLAFNYRDKYAKSTKESIILELEKDKGDIIIENLNVKNNKDLAKPISLAYDFTIENAIEEIGGKLYFSPLLFLNSESNPFIQEERIYPIDFIYPQGSKYRISVNLPEGYEIESLPENAKFQLNGDEGEFTYIIKENAGALQLIVNSSINKTLISPTEYNQFKEFFALSFEKQSEQIVLVKK